MKLFRIRHRPQAPEAPSQPPPEGGGAVECRELATPPPSGGGWEGASGAWRRLLDYACCRTGCREDAEDIVQDALLSLWRRQAEGFAPDNAVAYLYRTVSNLCASHGREAVRMPRVPLTALSDPPAPEAEDREAEYRRVSRLLNGIPDEQAEVIRLRYYGDKSFREIADILGIPLTTAKSRFVYGLEKIRRGMGL